MTEQAQKIISIGDEINEIIKSLKTESADQLRVRLIRAREDIFDIGCVENQSSWQEKPGIVNSWWSCRKCGYFTSNEKEVRNGRECPSCKRTMNGVWILDLCGNPVFAEYKKDEEESNNGGQQ